MRQQVEAQAVDIGDEVYFPNSRKAQAVETISVNEETGNVTISAKTARWTMAPDFEVAIEVEEETDGSSDE